MIDDTTTEQQGEEATAVEIFAAAAVQPEPETLSPAAKHFEQQAELLAAELPDYFETVNGPHFTEPLRDAIRDSVHGPALGYLLAKAPSEAIRLGDLPEEQMLAEIEELARMAPELIAREKDRQTQHRRDTTPESQLSDDECTMEEFMRREGERHLRKPFWQR